MAYDFTSLDNLYSLSVFDRKGKLPFRLQPPSTIGLDSDMLIDQPKQRFSSACL
ncbi:uncharacterized protein ARMOST_10317 [Armillaria ostoyae]|uniref:Uncharacterized protein n=1 Tax=Armillaria ostoyae TaxID=47428 RepID=A0A284RE26_ARMOS|nr:uncharacterized protein ARMOST_10317 [Armillaria ostoyae]